MMTIKEIIEKEEVKVAVVGNLYSDGKMLYFCITIPENNKITFICMSNGFSYFGVYNSIEEASVVIQDNKLYSADAKFEIQNIKK